MRGVTKFIVLFLFMVNFGLLIQESRVDLSINPNLSSTTESWQITWDYNDYDWASGIALDSKENLFICGTTGMNDGKNNDILLIKFDSSGHYKWNRTWGYENYDDRGESIALDSSDNIYITGYRNDGPGMYLIKFNSFGDYQWNTTANIKGIPEVKKLIIEKSENIYIIGKNGSVPDISDIFVLKFNNHGIKQWEYIYDDPNYILSAADLQLDSSNNLLVLENNRNGDIKLLKLSNSGSLLWDQTLDGIINSEFIHKYALAMVLDSADNIYITGHTGHGQSDFLLIKYDSSGNIQWFQTKNLNIADAGFCIAIDSLNNIYIAGDTGEGYFDMVLLIYDKTGKYQGHGIVGEEDSHDEARGLAIDNSNNIYIVGTASYPPPLRDIFSTLYDIMLIKNLEISIPSSSKIPSYNIFIIISLICIISIFITYNQKKKKINNGNL